MTLAEAAAKAHGALKTAGLQHAIGGGLALCHYGAPRAIADIDLNVFVPPCRRPEVGAALAPLGLDVATVEPAAVERDGEVRLDWDGIEIHLFFSCDELHKAMPAAVRWLQLGEERLPFVSPEHLVVRKALLDREKDWVDIEAILGNAEPFDLDEAEEWLRRLAGPAVRPPRRPRPRR